MEAAEFTLVQYKTLRKTIMDLLNKMLDSGNFDLNWGMERLGFINTKHLIQDNKNYVTAICDFVIFESSEKGARIMSKMGNDTNLFTKPELLMINKMISFIFSIFEVIEVDKESCTIRLFDILNKKEYIVMDIGMALSYKVEIVMIIRLVKIGDYTYMCTGNVFSFETKYKKRLLNDLQFQKIKKPRFTSADLFIWGFKQFKQIGGLALILEL